MILLELAKELLFPRKCILCGRILESNQTDLCGECRADQPEYGASARKYPYLDGHTAVWYYRGNARESLIRFKFHNKPGYGEAYGRMLAMRILTDLPGVDLITWVPVSARRKRQRGYDQSELIARAVSRELGLDVKPLLKKHRDNPAQSGISDPALRRGNVLGVYALAEPDAVKGKRVLLIDDILTTGATAGECARVLLTGGAESVYLACVAVAEGEKKQ